MRAAIMTLVYETPRNSAMTKAAAPMIGGMIWPPVDATASIAAAASGLNPVRFIMGMVSQPSTLTFATAEPEIVPNMLEDTTATLPGPPRAPPAIALAKFMKNWPAPDFSRNAPKMMKRMTYVPATPRGA